jgi:hypothetical protein
MTNTRSNLSTGPTGPKPGMVRTALRLALSAVAIVGLALTGVSCGENCFVADNVSILDSRDGIFLVYRVSGFQDKMRFFEIFRGKPTFDVCGSTNTPAIAMEPYLPEQGLLKKVEVHGDQLGIVYTQKASDSIKPEQARVSP